MNGIQEFVNKDFGTIRTVIIDNEPWFVAKDVCNILGIANPTDALNKGLEDFERARLNLGRQGGQISLVNLDFILSFFVVENLLQNHLDYG